MANVSAFQAEDCGFESRHLLQWLKSYRKQTLRFPFRHFHFFFVPLAQQAEHRPFKAGVQSSNLWWHTIPYGIMGISHNPDFVVLGDCYDFIFK